MQPVALALGSNIGDRLAMLRAAVSGLAAFFTTTHTSCVYETNAAYVTDQPAFLNAALLGHTKLAPDALLAAVKNLESELGRLPSFRYGPRAIDIDILFYGDAVIDTPPLVLPHPRMAEREFVLRPLADIAPEWKHPVTGVTVSDMLKKLPSENPKNLGRVPDV